MSTVPSFTRFVQPTDSYESSFPIFLAFVRRHISSQNRFTKLAKLILIRMKTTLYSHMKAFVRASYDYLHSYGVHTIQTSEEVPENPRHLSNVAPMLGHRLRCWPNIGQTLVDISCLLFRNNNLMNHRGMLTITVGIMVIWLASVAPSCKSLVTNAAPTILGAFIAAISRQS